jgi:sigma-B regulation protein RsbU (phosphoserine phosphatase)
VLYVDSTQPMHALSGLDRRILERLAEETTGVLEKVEMLAQLEEKKLLERDLQLAEQTQRALLPPRLPQVTGYRLQAHCQPTRHVGGDLYDFVTLDSERLVAVLADVSGKGVAASLLSSSVQGALQMLLRRGVPAAEVVDDLNRYLCERSAEGQFVTLFLLWVDGDGRGGFVNAGHPPAFVYRASTGAVEPLLGGGIVLGIFDSVHYQAQPLELRPGDLLLVYSDGLTDAESAAGVMFGEERVQELLARFGVNGAQATHAALLSAVTQHARGAEPTDDITLVLVERSAAGIS